MCGKNDGRPGAHRSRRVLRNRRGYDGSVSVVVDVMNVMIDAMMLRWLDGGAGFLRESRDRQKHDAPKPDKD